MTEPNKSPPAQTHEELVKQVAEHLDEYTQHKKDYLARQLHQDELQLANLKAINDLTKSTQGLVDAWTAANNLQRFVVWASKFAILAGAAAYLSTKFGIKLP